METHNDIIYHCVACGRVVHAEVGTEPPQCCGHTMAKAAVDTIRDGNVAGGAADGPPETVPPVIKGLEQPR